MDKGRKNNMEMAEIKQRIVEALNARSKECVHNFKLWARSGQYWTTKSDIDEPEAELICVARGWRRGKVRIDDAGVWGYLESGPHLN